MTIKFKEYEKVYLGNKIIDFKPQIKWKIQLTIKINFISSKDSEETRNMSTKRENVESMMGSENEIIEKILISFAKISRKIRRINGKKQICFC